MRSRSSSGRRARRRAEIDRVLATVLFTDIVGSTERPAALGDSAGGSSCAHHHDRPRDDRPYRGARSTRRATGSWRRSTARLEACGALGPSPKRCAARRRDPSRAPHRRDRAGRRRRPGHRGPHRRARRRARRAVEVSSRQTVKDLVAGSGLAFEDAGEHELKGVPDRWHLYRVVS